VLVEAKCDLEARNGDGDTAFLMVCMLHEQVAVVASTAAVLLDLGASASVVDSDGRGPLHLACMAGNLQLVRILMSRGLADWRQMDHSRCAAMSMYGNNCLINSILLPVSIEVHPRRRGDDPASRAGPVGDARSIYLSM
jgi:ankyrin repeat protein